LRAAPEHALAFSTRRQQFFPLHFDDVSRLGHPSFSLAHTAFELCARHLRICQLLTPGLKVGTHFHQAALCIAHLGSERIERELEIEANELRTNPDAEVDELCSIYERKGFPSAQAHELAERIVRGDPAFALDTMAREELGFDPKQLGGSAWVAAGTSLVLFALGAAVPLVPFVVFSGTPALVGSAIVSGIALFGLGAGITNLTGLNPIMAGARQLVFGTLAAAITYGIGSLVGGVIG